jgi:uncharacterized protein
MATVDDTWQASGSGRVGLVRGGRRKVTFRTSGEDLRPYCSGATAGDHPRMDVDRNGLEVLEREEAMRLLARATIGRIGIHASALPVVLPVNFYLDGDQILIRTAKGTKLDAATRNAVVAFEADDIDPVYHTGWSVVVTGVARELVDPAELERAKDLPIPHWASANGRYIAISTDIVSGRRLPPPACTN